MGVTADPALSDTVTYQFITDRLFLAAAVRQSKQVPTYLPYGRKTWVRQDRPNQPTTHKSRPTPRPPDFIHAC